MNRVSTAGAKVFVGAPVPACVEQRRRIVLVRDEEFGPLGPHPELFAMMQAITFWLLVGPVGLGWGLAFGIVSTALYCTMGVLARTPWFAPLWYVNLGVVNAGTAFSTVVLCRALVGE